MKERMSQKKRSSGTKYHDEEEMMMELRRGPWTLEEDNLLINYIACHGEGRWNLLARCSGLKRTGKSCRLRWLNYLKPDIKRGNLSPEEQLLILDLHSKWGNRWSRIAQHLPGRTDNEIKNYWRTRVQKQARQLRIDANSTVFRDAIRWYWTPRLLEKMACTAQPAGAHFSESAAGQEPQTAICNPMLASSPSTSSGLNLPGFSASMPAGAFDPFLGGQSVGSMSGFETDCFDLWGSVSASTVQDYPSSCIDDAGDGLWSLDELWHVRKLGDQWGGI